MPYAEKKRLRDCRIRSALRLCDIMEGAPCTEKEVKELIQHIRELPVGMRRGGCKPENTLFGKIFGAKPEVGKKVDIWDVLRYFPKGHAQIYAWVVRMAKKNIRIAYNREEGWLMYRGVDDGQENADAG